MILVVVEHDRGAISASALEAMAAARQLAERVTLPVEALTIGAEADALAETLGEHGAERVHQAHHDLLTDYGPALWGETVAQATGSLGPAFVVACGTDRGNEVVAQAAARLGVPFAPNCVAIDPGDSHVRVTRLRWGGSLLEDADLDTTVALVTVAHHRFEAVPAAAAAAGTPSRLTVELDDSLARSRVHGRMERAAGVTLATAPVVVGGGRGVGSAEGFAVLEELAAALGGVVGCSRAVTNNGWRNHADQVGQTGTRIAPQVYVPCGISGAVQHWVGAMASKTIIAINTDREANIVTKASYAVIGDLHEVVPAITAEVERRRGAAD